MPTVRTRCGACSSSAPPRSRSRSRRRCSSPRSASSRPSSAPTRAGSRGCSPRYLLAAAVATPIAGRLGDMFGKRRMLVLSLVVVRRSARRSPRSATRSRSWSSAARCRASAAASSRSASGSSATSSRASASRQHRPDLGDLRHRRRRRPGRRRADRRPPLLPLDLLAGRDHRRARRGRDPASGCPSRPSARRAGSTSAARCCSASDSCCRCSRSRAPTTGAGARRRRSG